MNPDNILPFLLFLLSALPTAVALAGLLIDERATLAAADAAAIEPAVRPTMQPDAEPRLSPPHASATVTDRRRRVSRETATVGLPHSAQCNIAIAT
jgi:hypothetical protein